MQRLPCDRVLGRCVATPFLRPMGELKPGTIHEGVIEKLAFGGQGLLRIQDFVVFVKSTIPGQTVKIQITKKHESHADAKLIEIIHPSPIEHDIGYERLPGCPLQSVRYKDQLAIKESHVRECFDHLGGKSVIQESAQFFPIIPSPEIFRYRNKMEFSFGYTEMRVITDASGERTYFDENPSLGFHPEGDWAKVLSVNDVFLCSERMNRIRTCVITIMKASGLPVWNPKINRGFWRSLVLRESRKTGEILVNFSVFASQPARFWEHIVSDLMENVPEITGITETENAKRNDTLDHTLPFQVLFGNDFLIETLGKVQYEISPFSFFQTNSLGAEKLFEVVREFSGLQGKEEVFDLFCGSGAIGLFLAEKSKQIIGIELDESAISDARSNAELNGFQNTEYYAGKVEGLLPEILKIHPHPDLVILDPPRTGLQRKAVETVKTIVAEKIIYVSCNPATLVRDLALIAEGGWRAQKIQPVDLFPHTPHIETVVLLVRE